MNKVKGKISDIINNSKRFVEVYKYLSIHPNFTFYSKNSTTFYGKTGRFIFIRLHKVGGTSIADALGLDKVHHTCKEAIELVGRRNWDNCYTFAFVRNPFSKIVSSYNYFTIKYFTIKNYPSMKDKPISFDEWVRKTYGPEKDPFYYTVKWFQPQIEWLKDKNNKITLNKIGKLENIEEDFKEIMEKIGITAPIPHLNQTKKTDYRKYYNEETYDIVKAWHQEDLDTFGYTFDNG